MATITYYQVCSEFNRNGKLEPVASCLDEDRAVILARKATSGEFKKSFLTARPPYIVRIMEVDYDYDRKPEIF